MDPTTRNLMEKFKKAEKAGKRNRRNRMLVVGVLPLFFIFGVYVVFFDDNQRGILLFIPVLLLSVLEYWIRNYDRHNFWFDWVNRGGNVGIYRLRFEPFLAALMIALFTSPLSPLAKVSDNWTSTVVTVVLLLVWFLGKFVFKPKIRW